MSYKAGFAVLLFAAACASQQPKITAPEIDVAQEVGPAELGYPVGPVELKYDFRITNQWTEPLNLIRVDVATVNPAGGAYSLERRSYNLREAIPAGETRMVSFWAKGYSWGHGLREDEPVTLRAIVYFETSKGSYHQVVMRELPQGSFR